MIIPESPDAIDLPPIFEPMLVPPGIASHEAAIDLAKSREDATGTVVVAGSEMRMDCAFILNPERPLDEALKIYHIAMVTVNDALGSLIPPQVAVTFRWPDRILINGAEAGGIQVHMPEGTDGTDMPEWLILRFVVELQDFDHEVEPGEQKQKTNLYDEGCSEVDGIAIIGSLGRYLLSWISRWETDGFAPIITAWDGRADGIGEKVAYALPGARIRGELLGLDADGGLLLRQGGRKRKVPLSVILRGAGWTDKAA